MNRKSHHLSLSLAIALTSMTVPMHFGSAVAIAGDLLQNGSFNDDADANNLPDGWINWQYGPTSFADYKTASAPFFFPFDNSPYVNAGNYGDWWSSGGGWYQIVPGVEAAYTFTGYSSTENFDNIAGEIRIIYLDAAQAELRRDVRLSSVYESNKAWDINALTTVAPAGTAFVKAEFGTFGARGAAGWDNARLVQSKLWQFVADGDWDTASNWNGGVPSAAGDSAQFANAVSASQAYNPIPSETITLGSAITLGNLGFNDAKNYNLAGTGSITLEEIGGGSAVVTAVNPLVMIDYGPDPSTHPNPIPSVAHSVSVPLTLASSTLFEVGHLAALNVPSLQASAASLTKGGRGTLEVGHVRAASLAITAGTVRIAANGTDAGTSKFSSLSVEGASTLDLTDNAVVVDYSGASPIDALKAAIVSGFNLGTWNGPGITSSIAAINPAAAIGIIEASSVALVNGTFAGQAVDGDAVLISYTLKGDTNLDGAVNFEDLLALAQTYDQPGSWRQGDFDYDGLVSFPDLLALAQSYGSALLTGDRVLLDHLGGPAFSFDLQHALSAVPEPATLSLVVLAGLGSLRRRR